MTKTEELLKQLREHTLHYSEQEEAADTIKQLVELCRLQHEALKLADDDLRSGVLWTGKGVSRVREAIALFDRFEKGE